MTKNDRNTDKRYAFVSKINKDYVQQYVDIHKNVWPELINMYRRAGLRNLTCFLRGDLLFIYFESADYEAAADKLASDPVEIEWQKIIKPMQDPGGFEKLEEVFHMD